MKNKVWREEISRVLDKKIQVSEIIKILSVMAQVPSIAKAIEKNAESPWESTSPDALEKITYAITATKILQCFGLNEKDANFVVESFVEFAEKDLSKEGTM